MRQNTTYSNFLAKIKLYHMKRRRKFNREIIILALILIAGFSFALMGKKAAVDSNPMYACNSDADCIPVQKSCCNCNYGGKAIAINRNYGDLWKSRIMINCTGILCPALISADSSCFAQPKCASGACKLITR